jgi:hypothetical protein
MKGEIGVEETGGVVATATRWETQDLKRKEVVRLRRQSQGLTQLGRRMEKPLVALRIRKWKK